MDVKSVLLVKQGCENDDKCTLYGRLNKDIITFILGVYYNVIIHGMVNYALESGYFLHMHFSNTRYMIRNDLLVYQENTYYLRNNQYNRFKPVRDLCTFIIEKGHSEGLWLKVWYKERIICIDKRMITQPSILTVENLKIKIKSTVCNPQFFFKCTIVMGMILLILMIINVTYACYLQSLRYKCTAFPISEGYHYGIVYYVLHVLRFCIMSPVEMALALLEHLGDTYPYL